MKKTNAIHRRVTRYSVAMQASLVAVTSGIFNNAHAQNQPEIIEETLTINDTRTWNFGAVVARDENSTGHLTIGNGGALTIRPFYNGGGIPYPSTHSLIIGYAANSDGTVTVDGADAVLNVLSRITVGDAGSGKLEIINGGVVSSTGGYIGAKPGGTGTVEVMGTGSKWTLTNQSLYIGDTGNGSMIISDNGAVEVLSSSAGTYIGYNVMDQAGKGTIEVKGGSTFRPGQYLYVGGPGEGELTISDGSRVYGSLLVMIGSGSTGTGAVTVTGPDSVLSSYRIDLAWFGTGQLNILNGAVVTTTEAHIGCDIGVADCTGNGTVIVDGQGSAWNNTDVFYVGHGGWGSDGSSHLTISSGGKVTNSTAYIGYSQGRNDTAKVIGDGSEWSSNGDLYLGRLGNAWLTISDGGKVTNATGYIGRYGGSSGMADVTGNGSAWINAEDLFVGVFGNSQLTISDGGTVQADAVFLAYSASASGTINIGAEEGSIAKTPGSLITNSVEFGDGNGILVFNHTATENDDYEFSASVSGLGTVNALAGVTTLTGSNIYSGTTTVSGGVLRAGAANAFSAGSDFVVERGALLDAGGLSQTIASLGNGGTVAIGANGTAGATLTVTDDYTGDGGTLVLRTALGNDSSATDRLVVEGDTSGTSVVAVHNVGGAGAPTVEGIEIITVGGASEGVFTLEGDYIVAGAYTYRLHRDNGSGTDPNDWYLRSALTPVDPQPEYHVGSPAYEAYPQALLALNGLNTLQQRMGNRLWAGADNHVIAEGAGAMVSYAAPEETGIHVDSNGVWGRIEGGFTHIEPRFSTTDTDFNQNVFKLQAGIDGLLSENGNGTLIGGVFAQYVHGRTKTNSTNYADGKISADGYGFGGTLTWYGNEGFYADGQAQVTWYDSDLTTRTPHAPTLIAGNDGFGYALSIETGKRIAIYPEWSFTPQAQLVYSRVDFDDFRDGFGSNIGLGRGDSLQGRLGITLDHQMSGHNSNDLANRMHVYGVANLYYEFLEGTRVEIADDSFASRKDRLWGGAGLGGSYNWNDGKYSIYGEGLVNTSLNNFGDSYSLKANVGFRMRW